MHATCMLMMGVLCWCNRWAMMLPPSIQVCPIEVPGRGCREAEPSINQISELATALAHSLPLQVIPYLPILLAQHVS